MSTRPAAEHAPTPHPLVDTLDRDADRDADRNADTVVTESAADIVAFSAARAEVLSRVDGRRLILLTKPTSLLTRPMFDMLHAADGTWVLRRNGSMSGDVAGSPAHASPTTTSSSDAKLSTAGASAPTVQVLRLEIAVRANLRSRGLGRVVERAAEYFIGRKPGTWGPVEPTVRPWDDTEIATYAEQRSPKPTYVVVTGKDMIGSLLVRRTLQGIEELTTLDVVLGRTGPDAMQDAIRRTAEFFDGLPGQPIVLHAMASTFTTRSDLLVAPGPQPSPQPLHMMLGATTLRDRSVDLDEAVRQFGAVRQIRGRITPLRFPLAASGTDSGGRERLRDIARWVGGDSVR